MGGVFPLQTTKPTESILSIYPSLSILSIYLPSILSIYPIYLSIYLSIYLLSIYLSTAPVSGGLFPGTSTVAVASCGFLAVLLPAAGLFSGSPPTRGCHQCKKPALLSYCWRAGLFSGGTKPSEATKSPPPRPRRCRTGLRFRRGGKTKSDEISEKLVGSFFYFLSSFPLRIKER